jgi:glucoamylase
MNYTTATPWSRLIEVQGFGGNLFKDATGATVGTVSVSANQVSRYITFSVDKAALGGTPTTGWAFTVALTGQDGTHGTDQTRGFASTPQAYAFGVCAVGGSAAICSKDPNSVPKVMDALSPTGVSQATELSTTPTVLQGVPIG